MKTTWTVDGENMIFLGAGGGRVNLRKTTVDHPKTITTLLNLWDELTGDEQDGIIAGLLERRRLERKPQ